MTREIEKRSSPDDERRARGITPGNWHRSPDQLHGTSTAAAQDKETGVALINSELPDVRRYADGKPRPLCRGVLHGVVSCGLVVMLLMLTGCWCKTSKTTTELLVRQRSSGPATGAAGQAAHVRTPRRPPS